MEPGYGAAHRRIRRGRRFCSMDTGTRSRVSTQAWTCGGTSDHDLEARNAHARLKPVVLTGSLVPLAAILLAPGAGGWRRPHRASHESAGARRARVLRRGAVVHAVEVDLWLDMADVLATYARRPRVLYGTCIWRPTRAWTSGSIGRRFGPT